MGALAVGWVPKLGPGVRAVSIGEDDPLRRTWNVVVMGAHFASMLAAREDAPTGVGERQPFDFVLTFDRDLIIECAQALMLRIAFSTGVD